RETASDRSREDTDDQPVMGSRQRGDNAIVHPRVVGKAVQEYDGNALRRTVVLVGDLERGSTDMLDDRRHGSFRSQGAGPSVPRRDRIAASLAITRIFFRRCRSPPWCACWR